MIVHPFLKWPGGKRWLASTLLQCYPSSFRRYFEPFLGGGASFFALQPDNAILSDINLDLINTYQQIRDNVEEVIESLCQLPISKEAFLRVRSLKPINKLDVAVRMIYLSKTAFNGMYRVNRRGEFNVPFGCRPTTKVCDELELRGASNALRGARILHADFEETVAEAGEGDIVYIDPPYTVSHANNGFVRYNESIFSWEDQRRLAAIAHCLANRGASVFVSNAAHGSLLELYSDFDVVELTRPSCISAAREYRVPVKEYLLCSRPQ
ncbi:MAG: DNA adenine methylase [Armatimonadota bacterium]